MKNLELVICPKCKSHNVLSYDNESLSHNAEWLNEIGAQNDPEIYIHFECQDCKCHFNQHLIIITPDHHRALTLALMEVKRLGLHMDTELENIIEGLSVAYNPSYYYDSIIQLTKEA